MNLLVHVEQYDVLGILPSQLESLAHVAKGIDRCAFIDGTVDGVKRSAGFERFESLAGFLESEDGPFVVFTPDVGEDIRALELPEDAWLMFGPSMGWPAIIDNAVIAKIPGATMNSRDAVPIALWELAWPER